MARYPRQDDPDGEVVVPSVTEIISDCTNKGGGLTQWASNCCAEHIKNWVSDPECPYTGQEILDVLDKARFAYKKVSDKALDVGSEVHNAIEEVLKIQLLQIKQKYGGQLIPALSCEQADNAYNAFLDWAQEHKLRPIELEKTVYGSRWADTLDFYGYFDDRLYVIDWKTSKAKNKKTGKGIYPEMRYQVAAYRDAMSVGLGFIPEAIAGCGVLRLDKETGMPDWNDTSKTYKQDLKVFNSMVNLYFDRHQTIAKRLKGE